MGLTDEPVIKVYRGFGNESEFFLMGHVLRLSPRPRKTYSKSWIRNMLAVVRLFMVKPMPDATVVLSWRGQTHVVTTQKDGFFKFHIKSPNLVAGLHEVIVSLDDNEQVKGYSSILIPPPVDTIYISDVDDTFLISHSDKTRRRLRELFTHNERNRKAFDGVVNHYQQLAMSGRAAGEAPNPFFYVSSSEWNLYDFIREFANFNELPKGVFLLGKMKRIKDFLHSGQNNHATKFNRIEQIVTTYPGVKFVLLGDDSQQDPIIYRDVAKAFPEKVLAVYIRNVSETKPEVQEILDRIKSHGIACCYFKHSSEALIHSQQIGLILK